MKLPEKYFPRISSEDFKGIDASDNHARLELIKENCLVKLEGNRPVLYIDEDDPRFDALLPHILKLKMSASQRSHNKGMMSILAGALNKKTSRNDQCTEGAVHRQSPELDALLKNVYAAVLDDLMKKHLPSYHRVGQIKLNQKPIHPVYKMGNTSFTSCIINFNSPFKLHKDNFNITNMLSAMIVYKHQVSGGHLVFPEYGIGFRLRNRAIIIFYGKDIIHGVTPINKHNKDAYRISVVLYASENLHECEPEDSFGDTKKQKAA